MSTSATSWAAIELARTQSAPRVPFVVAGQCVGSVALAHGPALRAWPHWLRLQDGPAGIARVHLLPEEEAGRESALASINQSLREQGLIRAWRDEPFPLFGADGRQVLARFERAAARFWGSLTLGAHANGYVAGTDGRPTHLWLATRALNKPTDPGLRDNLVGGGVPLDQTPWEALVREGWEEAGLPPTVMQQARPGRVIRIDRDAPEGRMVEHVHVFDLALPPELIPVNQDGEVAALQCLPLKEAAAVAEAGEMTVDAALVTLDFLLRHALLPPAQHAALQSRAAGLWTARG